MKSISRLVMLVAFVACCLAAGARTMVTPSKTLVSRAVNAGRFAEIEAERGVTVNYTDGLNTTVKITAPDNVINHVVVKVKGNELQCRIDDKVDIKTDCKVTIDVTAPAVKGFDAGSGAKINILNNLSVTDLDVDASSGAAVKFGGSVTARKASFESASGAAVSAPDCYIGSTDIEASSGAAMTLGGKLGNIIAEVSSAANVTLSGTAGVVNAEASSAASIDARGLSSSGGSIEASSAASVNIKQSNEHPFNVEKSSGGIVKFH